MKSKGLMAALAVGSAISLTAALATSSSATVYADAAGDRIASPTTDRNPLTGYEGYCTWGAQEQIHVHTGYYVRTLTGNAEDWANQARAAGLTVVDEPQPHSVAVYSSAIVGGVGHVAWVEAVNGNDITITEMNFGPGATAENGYRTAGFNQFVTRTERGAPGMSYILIP